MPELAAQRLLVVRVPSAEVLDGLLQHPETRDLLGERLGPTAVVIPEPALAPLRLALAGLKLRLDTEPATARA